MAVGVREAEVVERSRLEGLYIRHAPDGIRLAYLLTGDRDLAEDLVQEAFARMVGRLRHVRRAEAFGPYLRVTIVNLSRSHFRRRKLERAYLEKLARTSERLSNPHDDQDEALHEALLRLPRRQRAAIVLRFFEDLSEGQTADILRCRNGTVRSLVSRGMRSLRVDMQGVQR
jgi:RNA polymerase sigma-70 factor (sigma-E family)